jgi:hypothetical protein
MFPNNSLKSISPDVRMLQAFPSIFFEGMHHTASPLWSRIFRFICFSLLQPHPNPFPLDPSGFGIGSSRFAFVVRLEPQNSTTQRQGAQSLTIGAFNNGCGTSQIAKKRGISSIGERAEEDAIFSIVIAQ